MNRLIPAVLLLLLCAVSIPGVAGQPGARAQAFEVTAISTDGKHSIPVRLFDATCYTPLAVSEYNYGSSVTEFDTITTFFLYDSQSRVQNLTRWATDYSTKVRSAVQRDTFYYAADLLSYTYTHQYWGALSAWVNDAMTEYSLNGSGQTTLEWDKTWSLEKKVWQDGPKTKYDYDGQGRLSKVTESDVLGYGYRDVSYSTYTYNSKNQIDSLVEQAVGYFSTTNHVKKTYTYDGQGRVLTETNWGWNISSWAELTRSVNTYDDQNHIVTKTLESKTFTADWTPTERTVDTYDASGHILSSAMDGYDPTNNKWLPATKLTYTYSNSFRHVKMEPFTYSGSTWEASAYSLNLPYNNGKNSMSTSFYILEMDFTNGATAVKEEQAIPAGFALNNNYPNPFNPSTHISYSLPKESMVKLVVYNALGEAVGTVYDGIAPAGDHGYQFDAASLASGMYFYRLDARSVDGKSRYQAARKMLLVK